MHRGYRQFSRQRVLLVFLALCCVSFSLVTMSSTASAGHAPRSQQNIDDLELQTVSAQGDIDPAGCAALYGFARQPVPVAKDDNGIQVLATVQWEYNSSANLCYLTLDSASIAILRSRQEHETLPPTTLDDRQAAERCHNVHNRTRGFGLEPVPVAKTVDGSLVIAFVKWAFNESANL